MSKIKVGSRVKVLSVPNKDVDKEMKELIGTEVVISGVDTDWCGDWKVTYLSNREGGWSWCWEKENLELIEEDTRSKIKVGSRVKVLSVPHSGVAEDMKELIGTEIIIYAMDSSETPYLSKRKLPLGWDWNWKKENLELIEDTGSKEIKRAKKLWAIANTDMRQALAQEYGVEHFELEYAENYEDLKKKTLPVEMRNALSALGQLQCLMMQPYFNGSWKPDWTDGSSKYTVESMNNELFVDEYTFTSRPLAFKAEAKRDKFLAVYRVLIEEAKPLI